MRLRSTALVCAWVLTVSPAQAEGIAARVDAPKLAEGRPATVRATWTNTGPRPVLLERLRLVVTQGQARWSQASGPARIVQVRPLAPLADELVSLALTASEPLHPAAARLPLPPVTAGLDGEPARVLQLLGPGKSISLSLSIVPAAGALQCTAVVSSGPAPRRAYVRLGSTTWTTSRASGPGLRPGRDPLGARPQGRSVPVQVVLTRWAPYRGGPASELLVRGETATGRTPTTHVLTARGALFGRAQALARANVSAVEHAVRLADGRWILQGAGRFWVVGSAGAVLNGRGSLFPLALDLAKAGQAGFLWHATAEDAGLGAALKAAKFGVDRGKAWSVQVTAARLADYLALLSAQGVYPDARGIARTPPTAATVRRLTVDAKLLPNYPAALVSLDDHAVGSLPARAALKGWSAKGDLWIEPGDPEVRGLSAGFEGAVHPGLDTKVAEVATTFEALKRLPPTVPWAGAIPRARIQAGLVFLVRSSSGKVYKVLLERVEATVIKLRYATLPR